MNSLGGRRLIFCSMLFVACVATASAGFAFIIPTTPPTPTTPAVPANSTTPTAPSIPSPQAGFDCNSLKNYTQYDTVKVKLESIQYCNGQGYAPPRKWTRASGGVNSAESGSMSLSSKCPMRAPGVVCAGFKSGAGTNPVPAFNINFTRGNPNLTAPPFRTPVSGRVRLPCGGSMALNIGQLVQQGGQFANNVRFGNVAGAVSTGVNIASGLLSPCGGGILGMIQGAINMVMPAGCTVNITSGTAATCSGSVLSLPSGMTMGISSNGSLTLPSGGSFTDRLGATISIPGNSVVRVTGTAPNLSVVVTNPTTGVAQTYAAQTTINGGITEVNVLPTGGVVLVPDGANLPVDSSTTIPASEP